jgi:hypothetical protein
LTDIEHVVEHVGDADSSRMTALSFSLSSLSNIEVNVTSGFDFLTSGFDEFTSGFHCGILASASEAKLMMSLLLVPENKKVF